LSSPFPSPQNPGEEGINSGERDMDRDEEIKRREGGKKGGMRQGGER
jgi:hypothetical protein